VNLHEVDREGIVNLHRQLIVNSSWLNIPPVFLDFTTSTKLSMEVIDSDVTLEDLTRTVCHTQPTKFVLDKLLVFRDPFFPDG